MLSNRRSASRVAVGCLLAGSLITLPGAAGEAAWEAAAEAVALEARPFFYALSVDDAEASRAWYERVFGYRTVRSVDLTERGLRIRLLARDGAFLELIESTEARSAEDVDATLTRRHLLHGVFKIGLEVADLDESLRRLDVLGVELRGDAITEPDGSLRSAQIEDPDGTIIQLFEVLE